MKITAIILDGRHGGMRLACEYSPILKLPIQEETQLSIGEMDDQSVRVGDVVEYHECFRAVDKNTVLYSRTGKSYDVQNCLTSVLRPTYPIRLF